MDRTIGEELWLWRHRQRATRSIAPKRGRTGSALTRQAAAELLQVAPITYWRAETDRLPVRDAQAMLDAVGGPITPTVGELCALARRRSHMRLQDVVQEMGLSRTSYLGLEAQGEQRVLRYWGLG